MSRFVIALALVALGCGTRSGLEVDRAERATDAAAPPDVGADAPDLRCAEACSCDRHCVEGRCVGWEPGAFDPTCGGPDVTVHVAACAFGHYAGSEALQAQVCNRGDVAVRSGLVIRFADARGTLCVASTAGALAPGACEYPSCALDAPLDTDSPIAATLEAPPPGCGSPASDRCSDWIGIGCE